MRWIVVLLLSIGCAPKTGDVPSSAAASTASGQEAPTGSPFDDCVMNQEPRIAICGEKTLFNWEPLGVMSPEEKASWETFAPRLINAAVAGLEASSELKFDVHPVPLDFLPDGSQAALVQAKNFSYEGYVVADPDWQGICLNMEDVATPRRGCETLLRAAFTDGVPARLTNPQRSGSQSTAHIVEQPVLTYEGCQSQLRENGVLLACPDGFLAWLDAQDPTPQLRADLLDHLSQGKPGFTSVPATCRFHDLEDDACHVVSWRDEGSGLIFVGPILFLPPAYDPGGPYTLIECFTTTPKEENICSINKISASTKEGHGE